MSSLFNISKERFKLITAIVNDGGEITPEIEKQLEINQTEMQSKGVDYGFAIKHLNAEIDIIDAEIERLESLKKTRKNLVERLKTNLHGAMELFDVTEIKTPTIKINFRKSESVEIPDLAMLDSRFIKVKTVREPDKIAIKKAIESGESVQGATINVKFNLQIK